MSVDFNNVSSLAIPEGDVSMISSGDTVLWRKPVTNLVPLVGYTDDARWSASNGAIKTGVTGSVAVNEIAYTRSAGETVRFRLSGISWHHDSNCVFVGLAQGTFKVAFYMNAANGGKTAYCITYTTDGDDVILTFADPEQSVYSGLDSFKVSGYGSGANAIITQIN